MRKVIVEHRIMRFGNYDITSIARRVQLYDEILEEPPANLTIHPLSRIIISLQETFGNESKIRIHIVRKMYQLIDEPELC